MSALLLTHAGLLAAICVDPSDDTPRLLYADFCGDNGEVELEEFIRVQVQASKTPCSHSIGSAYGRPECRSCSLYVRGETLVRQPSVRASFCVPENWSVDYVGTGEANWPALIVRRGFACRVEAPAADFLTHGPAIVWEKPIERLRITDRNPGSRTGRLPPGAPFFWRKWDELTEGPPPFASEIPSEWLEMMVGNPIDSFATFGSAEEAMEKLNATALAWARAKAKESR